ncbi:SENP2 protease, partial [Baryphthengus martii]|nr:SENP2 protease [Baryphthengus martii]
QAMEREVDSAFGRGRPDEVMSSAFKLKVTREDLSTLQDLKWLNDEIVNFYFALLMERSKKSSYPTVHAFNTFFYTKLVSGGYTSVKRWTRGVDIFKKDLILVPVHLKVHWTLAVIDMRKKKISYYDSMGRSGKGMDVCETLLEYLQEESLQKRNLPLTLSKWTLRSVEPYEIPQQSNDRDCGVFMCKYADYISQEKPMNFTQTHMPYFRKRIAWEILNQQLL